MRSLLSPLAAAGLFALSVLPSSSLLAQMSWRRADVLPGRFGHAMAYDSARKRVVMFGGNDLRVPEHHADTWEWDGKVWRRLRPKNAPAARTGHAMAYDAARKRVVLFGGVDAQSRLFSPSWSTTGVAVSRC